VTTVEYRVRSVRSTGRPPAVVAGSIAAIAGEMATDGWELVEMRPLIYNGSASGYLLLAYERPAERS
jgi:hypothetical protein